jgi:hypothetical protein
MRKLGYRAGAVVILGGLALAISSSCGSDPPAAIADTNVGGSAGSSTVTSGAGGTTTPATGGAAGASESTDASVGSGGAAGSAEDLDATFFSEATVEIPDGAMLVGDGSLNDDAGDPPLDDAGSTLSDGAVVTKRYGIFCTGPDAPARKACTGPIAVCCYDSDTGNGSCTTGKCSTTAGTFTCDGPEDCDTGEQCCGSVSTALQIAGSPHHEYFTRCVTSGTCGKGLILRETAYVIVCKRAADCTAAQTCVPATNMPSGVGICQAARTPL